MSAAPNTKLEAVPQSSETAETPRVAPAPPPPPPARRGPPKPLLAVAAVAAIAGTGYYAYSRHFEETDDAQIDGNISAISPRISGTVKAVNVVENQTVKAGDVLAEVDPADYQVALDEAEATVAEAEAMLQAEDPNVPITTTSSEAATRSAAFELTSAQAGLSGAKKEQSQLTATLAQAKANEKLALIELERSTKLLADHAIPQSDLDARQSAAAAATALVQAQTDALAGAKDRIEQQESRVDSAQTRLGEVKTNGPRTVEARRASVIARQAGLKLAQAQLAQAKLNLSYTKILAPVNGIIGKKTVSAGDRVAPGQQLMALSEIDSVWVTADFRETQLERVTPGQPVDIHVDAINADLHGEVESIGGATGSRYSILPPENASGNYVKVVQRIPVRIRLNPGQPGIDRLRPGMSAEPQVRVQ